MKFLPLVVVAVVGMVGRAHAADSPQGTTREMAKMRATMKDTNNNGYLDKDELGGDQAFEQMLPSMDANNDGKLSIDEYVDFMMKTGFPPTLDSNNDGFVTKDELGGTPRRPRDQAFKQMLPSLDANNDGKLSIDEYVDFMMKRGLPPTLDSNNDGFVTKDELDTFSGPATVTDNCWNAMVTDTNNDKKISAQEFLAATSPGNESPEACTDNPGGASSMKAAFSLLSVFALALRLF